MPDILEIIKARDPQEREFHQAVSEVMESVKPVLDQNPFIARPRYRNDWWSRNGSSCSGFPGRMIREMFR